MSYHTQLFYFPKEEGFLPRFYLQHEIQENIDLQEIVDRAAAGGDPAGWTTFGGANEMTASLGKPDNYPLTGREYTARRRPIAA